jgi:hypothetical protein
MQDLGRRTPVFDTSIPEAEPPSLIVLIAIEMRQSALLAACTYIDNA